MEIDNVKRQMLQQEIAYNIQQTDALTRSLSPSADQGFMRSASHTSFESHSLRRAQKSRHPMDDPSKVRGNYLPVLLSRIGSYNGISNTKSQIRLEPSKRTGP